MIALRLRQLKMERGLTNSELAELTCTPLSTIVRLVSGQTTNPTWDVMLSIAEGLDVPMDEFSTLQNKRTIRENEMNHMQKYRVLGSSGRQAVDECLEREYVQWLRLLQKKGSRISYKETIDRIYDLDRKSWTACSPCWMSLRGEANFKIGAINIKIGIELRGRVGPKW